MARQKLIHLHSGQIKADRPLVASALTKGEIAVRHANDEPELYIRKEDDTLATFIDKIAIETKVNLAKTYAEGLVDAHAEEVTEALKGYASTGSVKTVADDLAGHISANTEEFAAVRSEFASADSQTLKDAKAHAQGLVDAHAEEVTEALKSYIKTIDVTNISGVTVSNVNSTNKVTINFEELIIDCGEF